MILIKVQLNLESDTHNSYPGDTLDFEIADKNVSIKFSDSDREVVVNKQDLIQLLKLIDK